MHARGKGSDYEKSERMKMDPRDTVKLRASLVTRQDTEMYSGTSFTRRRGEIGGGGREMGERESKKWRRAKDEREAIEAKRQLNVVE